MEGFLIICLVIVAYFLPAITASLQKHPKSTGVFTLNLLLGWTLLGWVIAMVWAVSGDKTTAASAPPEPKPIPPPDQSSTQSEIIEAARCIERALEAGQKTCGDAVAILSTVAAADGKVSRDELRIILNFCAANGAALPDGWNAAIAHLNAGVNMAVSGDSACPESFAELADRPLRYLSALHGAMVALSIGSKRQGKTARILQEKLETMIDQRAGVPAPISVSTTPAPEPLEPAITQPPPKAVKPPPTWVEQARAEMAAERQKPSR